MNSADIVIATNDGTGGCSVGDYWSTTFAKPTLDAEIGGTDDLTDTSCILENGYMNATFTRSYTTDDGFDRQLDRDASTATFIYAYHPSSDGLEYHGVSM